MLTIEDAARVLRGYTGSQTTGSLIDLRGARCAMGVLGGEELGLDPHHGTIVFQGLTMTQYMSTQKAAVGSNDHRIAECYDIKGEVDMIEIWNDLFKLSFTQIADKLEYYASLTEAQRKVYKTEEERSASDRRNEE